MVISAYKAEPEDKDSYPTVIDSNTTININTNTSGNLAAVAFNSGTLSSWGIGAANLNVYGTGNVAAYGGRAKEQSTGIYTDYSISVNGASLVGAGAAGSEGSLGIMTCDMKEEDSTYGDGIISATDGAVIIGAGGTGTEYSYGIYTANTEARNDSSIYAYGANDLYSAGLVTFISDERTRTVTADNGSSITACGRGDHSIGIMEYYLGGAEKPDAEFGGVRILIDDSESEKSSTITAYADTAAYAQENSGEADASQFKAPTGSVNAIGSDNINGITPNIAEFDPDESAYTYNGQAAKYIKFTKGETVDYSLYYNPADSSFYKRYDDPGVYIEKVEDVPGAVCDGNKITLTDDFKFYTSANFGLVLPEHTDIEVPASNNPKIIAGGMTDSPVTAGIVSMKGSHIKIEGTLTVSGGYGNDKDSYGIYADNVIYVSGNGILSSTGGCVNAVSGSCYSIGVYALRGLIAYHTLILANGGRIYADDGATGDSFGILSGSFVKSDNIYGSVGVFDSAYVVASGGGSGDVNSYGCVTSNIVVSDDSSLALDTYGDSQGAVGLGILLSETSEIDIFDNGSITGRASGGDESYGLCEILYSGEEFDDTKRISVNITDNGSMEFEGDTQGIRAGRRLFGNISVTDGENELTHNSDKRGYVDSEDKLAQRTVIKALPKADYAIYYSAEAGFHKNTADGEALTELPEGLSANGDTITFDDVSFHTTRSAALYTEGDLTLNIPENKRAALSVDNSDPEAANAFGMELVGNTVIRADGTMSISASGTDKAYALTSFGDLTVTGKGELIAAEFLGADDSYALMSTDDLTIEDSVHVYAYSLARYNPKTTVSSVMSRQVTVKDDAVLDTSGGIDANGIGIWDGYDLVTEGSASVIASGGVIMYGNADTPPGSIRASGNSSINVVCDHKSDGEGESSSVLDWGIIAARGEGSGGDTLIYVTDNAGVSVYTAADNGGAVYMAKAANGVNAAGGNAEGDEYALEYADDTYVLPGTDDNANYVLFKNAAVDYPLYFDGETSKLYKTFDFSFDQETGDVINVTCSDPIEVPGAICDGNKLTLTSDFQFYTDYMDGLYLGKDTTLYVPEGESPSVCGGFSGLALGDGIGGSSGIYCVGGNTLEIDGSLDAAGCGGKNISSWGIVNSTKNKPLNITGKGRLTARGGDIVYDETIEGSRGDSAGIVSYGDLNISIA